MIITKTIHNKCINTQEMIMRNLLVLFLVLMSLNVNGTAFTLGTGGYWRDVCLGKHDELNEKGSIAACTMLLLGYQAGAVEQARENKVKPSLCRTLDPNALPKVFAEFVNSDKKYEEMNVLDVLLTFTRSNKCGV